MDKLCLLSNNLDCKFNKKLSQYNWHKILDSLNKYMEFFILEQSIPDIKYPGLHV